MTQRNFDEPAARRLTQARRLFAVAAILAGARTGYLTVDNVTMKLHEQSGESWCERTVSRDLMALDSLGIAQRSGKRSRPGACLRTYRWRGHSEALTRIVLQSAEHTTNSVSSSALSAMLKSLPMPWEMDAEKHRLATHAARLFALADTEDRACLNCQLIYRMGEGWTLQKLDIPVSAFDRAKPLSPLAQSQFDEAITDAVA